MLVIQIVLPFAEMTLLLFSPVGFKGTRFSLLDIFFHFSQGAKKQMAVKWRRRPRGCADLREVTEVTDGPPQRTGFARTFLRVPVFLGGCPKGTVGNPPILRARMGRSWVSGRISFSNLCRLKRRRRWQKPSPEKPRRRIPRKS